MLKKITPNNIASARPMVTQSATGGFSVGPNAAQRSNLYLESNGTTNHRAEEDSGNSCSSTVLTVIVALVCLIVVLILVFVSKLNATDGRMTQL